MIVVHVTHEAVDKIGGIGAVVAGLVTSEAYQKQVSRTILLGPLLQTDRPVNRRLGDGGRIIYSSLDAVTPPPWNEKFGPIEKTYDVGVIYGARKIEDPCDGRSVNVEVLLMDVFHANKDRLNLFKGELFKKFAVPSQDFEKIWEYEEYVRLAEPGFEALKAVGVNGDEQVVVLAHEYMGMPTALKFILSGSPNTRTVFYAHEVASVRPIVEHHQGHDTMFYNVLCQAEAGRQTLEEIFPSVHANYKHPLVKAARYCDHVFAVGDYVQAELRFLEPHFRTMDVDLVYNGIPSRPLKLQQKLHSRGLLRSYTAALFGGQPTWVFSHVARPVLSKGIWRDIGVLSELEPLLRQREETAVYFMLGTLGGQRRGQDVRQMERVYGWPVRHEVGYPDLCGGEEVVGEMFDQFNRAHQSVRAVLVNQWDWNRQVCGDRMPGEMSFADLRWGTDVEFGLSIYEPFGISQFEPLCFGALCVVSNVCGCMGYAQQVAKTMPIDDNVIEASYLDVDNQMELEQLLEMTIAQRDVVEARENARLATLLDARLPRDEQTLLRRIQTGAALAERMSWDHVVTDYFMPTLRKVAQEGRLVTV
jgi:hypothetical protein